MFLQATKSQTGFMLKQKSATLVFYALLIMVLLNFLSNVLKFQGSDVIEMIHPMKLLLLSYNRVNYNADATLLLVQLFPLLVVCPAGFSLTREQHTGQELLMIARIGNRNYKFSKLLAAFLSTAIVFTVPFLLEILLNCLSFPLAATGDLTNWGPYDTNYIKSVHNYLISGLYVKAPYLYTVLGTLLFGVVSGMLGAFTMAFSSIIKFKFRILLFLPVYLLLNATLYLPGLLPDIRFTTGWYDYLLLFNDKPKSTIYLILSLLAIILFSVCSTFLSSRKECGIYPQHAGE